jgi:hypothetical protein
VVAPVVIMLEHANEGCLRRMIDEAVSIMWHARRKLGLGG